LEPQVRGTGSRAVTPLPDQPADNKREHKPRKGFIVGKDKEAEEIKESKESVDKDRLKSELMERLEERRVTQHEMPDTTKRRNKENYEKSSEIEEDVKRQRGKNLSEMEAEDVAASLSRLWKATSESEKSLKASLQFSVAKRRGSSGERDSGVSVGSCSEGKQSFMSPLHPREDDSLLHGSSELMLVLLPETNDTHTETGRNCKR
jgi:hypothetical protein